MVQPVATAADSAIFVAPTPGVPAAQRWLQKGNLAADHVAAGAFDSAMRLLNRSRLHLTCRCNIGGSQTKGSGPTQCRVGINAFRHLLLGVSTGVEVLILLNTDNVHVSDAGLPSAGACG